MENMFIELMKVNDFPFFYILLIWLCIQVLLKIFGSNSIEYVHRYLISKKNSRIKELLELNDMITDSELDDLVQEEVKSRVFEMTSGISVDKSIRTSILFVSKDKNIPLSDFKKAQKFLRIIDGHLNVVIDKVDTFEKYFNIFYSITVFLAGLYFLIIPIVDNGGLSDVQKLEIFAFCVFMFIFSLYIISRNQIFKSAERIKRIL
ncbi:hypothetical protein [Aggregatibacter aphrophilus]|uniref:Uncharacterized protein n=1 Tax=Aggregatibacter aphrophilus TaxID=732 RepID=A0AAP7GZB9_AGGAP|nr:hypothetical protein [Aggregatibacter aphrophilus]OBY53931.1 hypothetical protein BBB52_00300 [Aggregatibacter aphrophilus]